MKDTPKPIAFYLPQFHPIPENDEWWGKGFTEWTNVKKAKSLFFRHNQPRGPDKGIGYYDVLADENILHEQINLAQENGVQGFCFYHYWFEGKKLLEKPIEKFLNDKSLNFPFCLCWANETWSRRWLGEEKDILIKQTYSENDDYLHIKYLLQFFKDKRYITKNNRPLFLIYRPHDIPSSKTLEVFRAECNKAGVNEPYFLGVNGHSVHLDFKKSGYDATLFFYAATRFYAKNRRTSWGF